jgi:hypothetical protein
MVTRLSALIPPPETLLNQHRTFGPFGPAYKICQLLRKHENGDADLLLQVLETGEQVEVSLFHVLLDPETA